jgi:hypothetical protein
VARHLARVSLDTNNLILLDGHPVFLNSVVTNDVYMCL